MKLESYTTAGFDRGAPRWQEGLWMLVKALFFLNAVPWPSAWRASLLRIFGAQIGHSVVIRNFVNITYPWRFRAGNFVWLGEEVLILSLAPVELEANVCLSQRTFLCTGSHAFGSPGFDLRTRPITVRAGSWVAAQAFVAPGVEIGPDSMVCAGSVVLERVWPGQIVAGNPAQVKNRAEPA